MSSREVQNTDGDSRKRGGWKPGQSGNPGGRPKVAAEFRERCRELMEREGGGWDLAAAMLYGHPRDRRWAIEFLASYAYGKPAQLHVHEGGEKPLVLKVNLVPVAMRVKG